MALYEYEHVKKACSIGKGFEVEQPMSDDPLTTCPQCHQPVKRLISRVFVSTPTGDSQLKNMGFTKLVRRDKGIYENVTATGNESRYFDQSKPETMPDLKRKIGD